MRDKVRERSSQPFSPSLLSRKNLALKPKSPNRFRNFLAPHHSHLCKFYTQALQLSLIIALRLSEIIVKVLSLFCQFIKCLKKINAKGNYRPKCRLGYSYNCCLNSLLDCVRVEIYLPFVITWTQFLSSKYKFWARVRVGKIGDVMGHLFHQLRVRVHKFFCFPFIISNFWGDFICPDSSLLRAAFGWFYIILVLAFNARRNFIDDTVVRYIFRPKGWFPVCYKLSYSQVISYLNSYSLLSFYYFKLWLSYSYLFIIILYLLSFTMSSPPSFKDVILNNNPVVPVAGDDSNNPNLTIPVGEFSSDCCMLFLLILLVLLPSRKPLC